MDPLNLIDYPNLGKTTAFDDGTLMAAGGKTYYLSFGMTKLKRHAAVPAGAGNIRLALLALFERAAWRPFIDLYQCG